MSFSKMIKSIEWSKNEIKKQLISANQSNDEDGAAYLNEIMEGMNAAGVAIENINKLKTYVEIKVAEKSNVHGK